MHYLNAFNTDIVKYLIIEEIEPLQLFAGTTSDFWVTDQYIPAGESFWFRESPLTGSSMSVASPQGSTVYSSEPPESIIEKNGGASVALHAAAEKRSPRYICEHCGDSFTSRQNLQSERTIFNYRTSLNDTDLFIRPRRFAPPAKNLPLQILSQDIPPLPVA